jgi:nicotinate-nucleotide--dimethylbenzimidazole phosphoribosyltransferase
MSSSPLADALQAKIDHLTKPLGSLGKIERIALKLGLLQQSLTPNVGKKRHIVFAADHAITEEGVSAYPSSVTAQMVFNFLRGGAAVNVFGRLNDVEVTVVDVGVDFDFATDTKLVRKKVRKGARNFMREPALTPEEARQAIAVGRDMAVSAKKDGVQLLSLGEMGIGNTTPAATIAAILTGCSPMEVACYGTGIDETRRRKKATIIEMAIAKHQPDPADAFDILCKVGGLEIAAIMGACAAAHLHRLPVILDGYICLAGGALACLEQKDVSSCLFGSHKGVELAHRKLIECMGLEDFLDLDMRLGEGTGAVLATHIFEAACRMMEEMATFDSAHVDRKHA